MIREYRFVCGTSPSSCSLRSVVDVDDDNDIEDQLFDLVASKTSLSSDDLDRAYTDLLELGGARLTIHFDDYDVVATLTPVESIGADDQQLCFDWAAS